MNMNQGLMISLLNYDWLDYGESVCLNFLQTDHQLATRLPHLPTIMPTAHSKAYLVP